jgi:anaerobic magnesium-protoporphyrin IX monomethyl ester cyclase
MKVTLIQPKYFNIWEALGLAYIGAHLKKEFPGKLDLKFYQGNFDDDSIIIEDAKTSDVVGFSCTSPVFKPALHLAQSIKEINPGVRTVFGGFHPSAIPNDCLEEDAVDQVIVGEGEEAFLSILLGENAPLVQGERFRGLNEIFPDRTLIRNIRTVDLCEQQIGKRITSFQSVRVCPFRCSFCAERVVTGIYNRNDNPLSERNPVHLLDEIELVAKELNLDYFKFADATWNTSIEKVTAFCEEKIKRKFKLPWDANVHASFADKEMLRIMKAADCQLINVGVESGSQRILNDMKKGLSVKNVRNVFRWGKELGLERRGFFFLGMPNETEEDIRLTEKLVEEIQPEVFGVTILSPYPGTNYYDPETMKDYDWTFADEYSNPYWRTQHFSNAEIKRWQAYLTDKFSNNLSWHNKIINDNPNLVGQGS